MGLKLGLEKVKRMMIRDRRKKEDEIEIKKNIVQRGGLGLGGHPVGLG